MTLLLLTVTVAPSQAPRFIQPSSLYTGLLSTDVSCAYIYEFTKLIVDAWRMLDGFEHLHEHAHKFNLRLVILNRREYRGSSKHSDADLRDLDQGSQAALDKTAGIISEFLLRVIDSGIPPPSPDGGDGGLVVLGWSMGNATSMAPFSDISLVTATQASKLQEFVKHLVLYGAYGASFRFVLADRLIVLPGPSRSTTFRFRLRLARSTKI